MISPALQKLESESEMCELSSIEEEPVKAPRIEVTGSDDGDSLPSYISLAEVTSISSLMSDLKTYMSDIVTCDL